MHWNDWPIACWIISTLLCLLGRRWIDALVSACLVIITIFERISPASVPIQLKWIYIFIGIIIITTEVAKKYRKYKDGLAAR